LENPLSSTGADHDMRGGENYTVTFARKREKNASRIARRVKDRTRGGGNRKCEARKKKSLFKSVRGKKKTDMGV